jgi:drug/metabolite transporter (DMT)-like permease
MRLQDFSVLLVGVLLNAFAQLGLKAATRAGGAIAVGTGFTTQMMGIMATPAFWLAIAAYGLSVIVWVVGLSRVPVSQAYPMLSIGYVLNIGLAWMLFGETPTMQRTLGILVIVVGVTLVARS